MNEESLKNTESVIGLSTKVVAGVVFFSFVIGLSFSSGWQQGLGLLLDGSANQEIMSYIGFLVFFSLLPEIGALFIELLSSWKAWGIGLGAFLFGVGFQFIKMKFDKPMENNDKGLSKFRVMLNVVFITALIFLIIVSAYEHGESRSKEKLNHLFQSGCSFKENGWSECHIIVVNNKIVKQGYLVSNYNSKVVIIDLENKEINMLNLPKEAVIKRRHKSEKSS